MHIRFPLNRVVVVRWKFALVLVCALSLYYLKISISLTTNLKEEKRLKIGDVVRSFHLPRTFLNWKEPTDVERIKKALNHTTDCPFWSVVLSTSGPTEAVRRQSRLKSWCIVIVADTNTPSVYDTGWVNNIGQWNKRVEFLTVERQKQLHVDFVHVFNGHSLSGKNVGYLYALTQGAQYIWDFDDNNEMIFYGQGIETLTDAPSLPILLEKLTRQDLTVKEPQRTTDEVSVALSMNPYPILGGGSSWPRGLPRVHARIPSVSHFPVESASIPSYTVAVLQSVALHEPDVDVRFHQVPFDFARQKDITPIMVPTSSFTPYNDQATLHMYSAFWALLLPSSVPRGVSDIWRSYFSQRLFKDFDLRIGFVGRPMVVQTRNAHNSVMDVSAESMLDSKTESLLIFLSKWKSDAQTLPERMEQLWIELYERNYIEISDVIQLQLWINALHDIGYDFPSIDSESNHVSYDSRKAVLKTNAANAQAHQLPTTTDILSNRTTCVLSETFYLWTSDFHDGIRMDMPSILGAMGQHSFVYSHKGQWAPHHHVLRLPGVEYGYPSEISSTLNKVYLTMNVELTDDMIQENFDFFKNHRKFLSSSAILCGFPASMCEIFLPFNKTIVFSTAARYNLGRCDANSWGKLNKRLQNMAVSVNPPHFVTASNTYDVEYIKYYTGIEPLLLESSAAAYLDGFKYKGNKDTILYMGHYNEEHILYFQNVPGVDVKTPKSLYGFYTMEQILDHRAVVFVPYSIQSFKFVELYALSIPLFVPSLRYYNEKVNFGMDRTVGSHFFCDNKFVDAIIPRHPNSTHPYSPNQEREFDPEAELYWLQFSDFYASPYITYFDDAEDLANKIKEADFLLIHKLMLQSNAKRRALLERSWCNIMNKTLDNGKTKVPTTWQDGMMPYDN